jgi:prevent-host-death family protein
LEGLTARQSATVLDVVARTLTHEPTVPTRHRKVLRANAAAPWELRIGDLRVYYEVKDDPERVVVKAIGVKVRDRVLIGGEDAAVKTVEMAQATASLSDYARKARKETLIVTRRGKPVAVLMPVDSSTDLENLIVTTHPTFQAIMERSEVRYKTEGGLSTKQVRARLAARRQAGRKAG